MQKFAILFWNYQMWANFNTVGIILGANWRGKKIFFLKKPPLHAPRGTAPWLQGHFPPGPNMGLCLIDPQVCFAPPPPTTN